MLTHKTFVRGTPATAGRVIDPAYVHGLEQQVRDLQALNAQLMANGAGTWTAGTSAIFLTLWTRIARVTARAEQAEAELADTRRAREEDSAERRAERAWFKRENVPPAYKLVVTNVLWRLGATFGNPNSERQYDLTQVRHRDVAREVGISEKVVGDYIAAMYTSTPEHPIPLLRRQSVKKETTVADKKTGGPKKVCYTTNSYAVADGGNFQKVLADPLTMPVPTTFKRQAQNTAHVAVKRAEERAAVAEAARIIEGRCPSCGSLHVDLRCHACDTITPINQVPVYSAPELGADSAPMPAPAREDALPPHNVTSTLQIGVQGAESAPLLVTKESTSRCVGISGGAESAPSSFDITEEPQATVSEREGEEGVDVEYPDAVRDLVAPEYAAALSGAVGVLVRLVGGMGTHVAMQPRAEAKSNKYLTIHSPLTPRLIAEHLVGTSTLGTGLLTQEDRELGRRCRAVAYDSDAAFTLLTVAAQQLSAHGVTALLVRNTTKRNSGHLWVLFDEEVDPARAFAVLESWAPGLRTVGEKFPDPKAKGGRCLRLPGGSYLPVGTGPVPVEVAVVGQDEAPVFEPALSPLAWVLLAGAVNPAVAIRHAWIPPDMRPRPAAPATPKPRAAQKESLAAHTIDAIVDRFNAEHPVHSLVDVNGSGMFRSPWHADTTPSCKLHSDGHWCDYSRDRRGGDALSLYCALNDFWPLDAEKPERLKALVHAGYELPARKEGCTFERRGDDLLVHLTIADSTKFNRAKESLKNALGPRFSADDKAWVVPMAQAGAVQAWAKAFAAAERGGQT